MDIALPADGLGVAKAFGHGFDGPKHVTFRLRLGINRTEFPECVSRKDGTGPRPKIFGGELITRDGLLIGIDVGRVDRPSLPGLIEVLK